MSDPWEGCTQPWGPGSLEDYAKLRGQSECDAIEAIEIFIRRNVDTKYHGHLLDNDDNDGQYLRNHVWKLIDALAHRGADE